jgi:hypothetical protein
VGAAVDHFHSHNTRLAEVDSHNARPVAAGSGDEKSALAHIFVVVAVDVAEEEEDAAADVDSPISAASVEVEVAAAADTWILAAPAALEAVADTPSQVEFVVVAAAAQTAC